MNHSLYQDGILKALPFKRLPWMLGWIMRVGRIDDQTPSSRQGDFHQGAFGSLEPDLGAELASKGADQQQA